LQEPSQNLLKSAIISDIHKESAEDHNAIIPHEHAVWQRYDGNLWNNLRQPWMDCYGRNWRIGQKDTLTPALPHSHTPALQHSSTPAL